jgi:uncharacterized membrane protein YkoI
MRFVPVLFLWLALTAPAVAGVENQVRDLVQAGVILPFDEIRDQVRAETPGDYMGADFDAGSRTYRFRFLVNGNVINVDVDARSGKRVRRSGRF